MSKLWRRVKRDFRNMKSIDRKSKRVENSLGALLNSNYEHLKNPAWDEWSNYRAWFRSLEVSHRSQNGEDGILLAIFDEIGVEHYRFIEFGIGNGEQCNAANLAKNFGWKGLMIEGNTTKAQQASNFYQDDEVTVLNEFITKENINALFRQAGFEGEIDLLSVDIDGNDYWIWREIEAVNPRVVVVEYNSSFGLNPVTVEYDPTFDRFSYHKSGLYHGMSLTAAEILGIEKGYSLIGTDSMGVNAFFVRNDINLNKFRSVKALDCFNSQFSRDVKFSKAYQKQILESFNKVEVS